MIRSVLIAGFIAAECVSAGALTQSRAATPVVAVVGDWQLNPARTHYGAGVEQRREERFTCVQDSTMVSCNIKSIRADGRVVDGRFSATLDGPSSPVSGMPDVDGVRLASVRNGVVDAVFSRRGTPVFGYRAYRAADDRSLMIVSMDPVSKAVLTTVVVYDRRPR